MNRLKHWPTITGIFFALLGALGVWWSTPKGVSKTFDSHIYLSAAENLRTGQGYIDTSGTQPKRLTHFPPLYPAVLAVSATVLQTDVSTATRVWNAVCLVALVLLSQLILKRTASHVAWIAPVGAAILLGSATVQIIALSTWSELQFLCLLCAGLLALQEFLSSGQWQWLAIHCVLFAAATLTRYVGLMLVPLSGLLICMLGSGSLRRQLGPAIAGTLGSGLPVLGWLWYNSVQAGNMTNRTLQIAAPGKRSWYQILDTIGDWLIPTFVPRKVVYVLVVLAIILGAIFLLAVWRRSCQDRPKAWSFFVVALPLFSLCYLGFVISSRVFLDPAVPFDFRILSPVFLSIVLLGVTLLASELVDRHRIVALLAVTGYLLLLNLTPRFGLEVSGYQYAIRLRHQGPASSP